MLKSILKFAVALAVAGLVTSQIYRHIPNVLGHVDTDVIGYSLWANFNINRIFENYLICGLGTPLLTLLLFAGIQRRFPSSLEPPASWGIKDVPAASATWMRIALSQIKILFVGMIIGTASIGKPGWLCHEFVCQCLLIGAIYWTGVQALAWLASRKGARSTMDWASLINSLATPLTLLPIGCASAATRILETGGSVHFYPWLGWKWVLLMICTCAAVVGRQAAQAWKARDISQMETDLVFFIPIAVLVFLTRSELAGNIGAIDLFHEGETLASGYLLHKGFFPWRDLLFIHGLLEDPFRSLYGIHLFGATRWATVAGRTLVLSPLYWVLSYWFMVALFRKNRGFVLLAAFLLPSNLPWLLFGQEHFRFLINPLLIISFFGLLKYRKPWNAVVFCALALAGTILTPESAFNLAAFGLCLIGFEALSQPRAPFLSRFSLTIWVCVSGLVFVTAWFLFLSMHNSLGDFFFYFANFASGHRFAGGIPLTWPDGPDRIYFKIAAIAPVLLIWVTCWMFAYRRKTRRDLNPYHWTAVALAGFMMMYYIKFISRADVHVHQSYVMCLPLFFILAYLGINWLDAKVATRLPSSFPTRHAVTWLIFLAVLLRDPTFYLRRFSSFPSRYVKEASANTEWTNAGYADMPKDVGDTIVDFRTVLDTYLKPDEPFFDFTTASSA